MLENSNKAGKKPSVHRVHIDLEVKQGKGNGGDTTQDCAGKWN